MTMKTAFVRLALLLSLLVSCAPVRDRRTLNEMEALMPERPDSALAVLQGLRPRDLPGLHVRPLHALLLSEALDKNYIDLTDDSLALAANRFYGEHGSKLHRLKSWYYLGRIRFNSGNYAEAVICYNKALEYAESLENYHYIGLINREIANAYTKVWDNYHAVDYIEKSIDAFSLANEQHYLLYSYLALARLYRLQKQYGKSNDCLAWILDNTTDSYLIASAYELKGLNLLSEEESSMEEIINCFRKAHIGTILQETPARLSCLAYIQQLSGNNDSSSFYINRAIQSANTLNDSLTIAFTRFRIADTGMDASLAKSRLEEYLSLQDPSIIKTLDQSISYYQGTYYRNESRIRTMKGRIRALFFSFAIILLTILSIFLKIKNRRQEEQLIDEIARTSEVCQELSSMNIDKQEMGMMIATLFENRIKFLQTLSDQYDLVESSYNNKLYENKEKLSKEEIISSFREIMRSLRNDKDINLSMEDALNMWKDGIMKKFRLIFEENSSHIRMSEEDFELAPYYFSGFKQSTISYLTGYTEHAIKQRKYRIRQRINALDASYSNEKTLFLSNMR